MDLKDSVLLPCDRATAWAALNDPDVLARCIPGCETLTMDAPDHMTAVVALKVGPVKARFEGEVTLSEIVPEESYLLSGHGKGGVAGFAKGSARVRLERVSADETMLNYDASADVGGKLAQLGSRLLDSTARKLAAAFFENIRTAVGVTEEVDG
ncbi:SRPBCC family protein [Acuticoccus mangrovi]|uniref:Carbon monoxide dehydrogenase subunit G n=1 Tax=Acuticoccus mangrovi TaxID=2796142 RepID=A0A934MIC7_9HYPH|nr:carbon monoxide dehydrogenase subunit G [Acuticoccus mangrovi]MBJ3777056.1 carbon monoxide dehydrogenase subunit G [Acuticoccus mangrovi]